MSEIKFSDFQIIPILDSVKKLDMSDEMYFSNKFAQYISNSRLKNINPNEGGYPQLYQNPPRIQTTSLAVGLSIFGANSNSSG